MLGFLRILNWKIVVSKFYQFLSFFEKSLPISFFFEKRLPISFCTPFSIRGILYAIWRTKHHNPQPTNTWLIPMETRGSHSDQQLYCCFLVLFDAYCIILWANKQASLRWASPTRRQGSVVGKRFSFGSWFSSFLGGFPCVFVCVSFISVFAQLLLVLSWSFLSVLLRFPRFLLSFFLFLLAFLFLFL